MVIKASVQTETCMISITQVYLGEIGIIQAKI